MLVSRAVAALGARLSVKSRLWALAVVAVIGPAAVASVAWVGSRSLEAATHRREAFEALSTQVRDFRNDVARLRGSVFALAADHNKLVADRLNAEAEAAAADLARLKAMPAAATVAERLGEIERLIGETRGAIGPVIATHETIGFTLDGGLTGRIVAGSAAMAAPIKAAMLGGGGEDAYRLAHAFATLQSFVWQFGATREQETIGGIEMSVGRMQRTIGRAGLEPEVAEKLERDLRAYATDVDAWVKETGEGIVRRDRLVDRLDLLAEPIEAVEANARAGLVAADADLDATRATIARTITAIVSALFLGAALLAALTARSILRPLGRLRQAMERVVEGDHGVVVGDTERADEIGGMARSLVVFRDRGAERDRLSQTLVEEADVRSRRAEAIAVSARAFEAAAATALERIRGTADHLAAAAGGLDRSASDATDRAGEARTAVESAESDITSAGGATEELAVSVAAIAERTRASTEVARDAVAKTERTVATLGEFARLADRIGAVVGLIRAVAGQTNLLALNATIEAARAGEAGRGFAVVASEVKALAGETARATEEIAAQVDAIQSVSADAVMAIGEVDRTIGQMAALAEAVAEATAEQTAVVSAIAGNMHRATGEAQRGVGAIDAAGEATRGAGAVAGDVGRLAGDLGERAEGLAGEVERFLASIEAA